MYPKEIVAPTNRFERVTEVDNNNKKEDNNNNDNNLLDTKELEGDF